MYSRVTTFSIYQLIYQLTNYKVTKCIKINPHWRKWTDWLVKLNVIPYETYLKRHEMRWFSEKKNTIFSDQNLGHHNFSSNSFFTYFLWLWLCRIYNIVSYQYDSFNKWTLVLNLGLHWRKKRPWTRWSRRNWLVIYQIPYFILLILSNIGLNFCKILRNEKNPQIPWFN